MSFLYQQDVGVHTSDPRVAMETYWREVQSIEEEEDEDDMVVGEEAEDEEKKSVDGRVGGKERQVRGPKSPHCMTAPTFSTTSRGGGVVD